ncbi:MAG: ATP-binding protein [Bacteroidota bacterium]|jgi:signal transduction histidine kinase
MKRKSMRKFTVRQKIQVPIILFISVLSLFMFIYFPSVYKTALRDSFGNEVQSLAQMVANGVTIGLNNQDWEGMRSSIDFVRHSEDIRFVALVDTSGATFTADPANFTYAPAYAESDTLIVASYPVETDLFTGIVVVGSSSRFIDTQVNSLRRTTFWVALVTMVVGIFFGMWQANLIVRPLSFLRRAAIKVAHGDLDTPVERRSGDEIGDLAAEFSRMITSVRLAQEGVKEVNEELQGKNELLEAERRQLARTLEHLRSTQAQLVQSGKMAALGQLIAGIAHEINTPLGAIRASISNIERALGQTLQQLPTLMSTLNAEQQERFFALVSKSLSVRLNLSTREERERRKELLQRLEAEQFDQADAIADALSEMSLFEDWEEFETLLRHHDVKTILQVASRLTLQQRNSQNIETAVERASKIVFALKNFSHHDSSGKMTLSVITEGIDTVLTLYHSQLKLGVEVTRQFDVVPPVLCFPDELNQVWTNLIHNAIQAMHEQGQLDIEVHTSGAWIVTSISDSGEGIPADLLEKIFDPFFTTKGVGEGTGLGLDIVRRIVEKHRGDVAVESIPGKTTFTVRIPLLQEQPDGDAG